MLALQKLQAKKAEEAKPAAQGAVDDDKRPSSSSNLASGTSTSTTSANSKSPRANKIVSARPPQQDMSNEIDAIQSALATPVRLVSFPPPPHAPLSVSIFYIF
jgi:hypothetical protein